MSVILVTHNLGIVAQLADRAAVMYAGRIAEISSVEDLLNHPIHPYAAALIAAVPVLNGRAESLKTIPGSVPSPDRFGPGCRFCERCERCRALPESDRLRCRETPPELCPVPDEIGHLCACHFPLSPDSRERRKN